MVEIQSDAANLYQTLCRYDLEGLQTICMQLGIPFEDLVGEERRGKARELILWLQRRERLVELRAWLEKDASRESSQRKGSTLAHPADFVIVTALEEERDAILEKLPAPQKVPPSTDDIRVYYYTYLPATFPDGSTCAYAVVVLPLLSMGRVQAAAATADAIRRWSPRHVLLVGIAGGVAARGVCVGDVLVADQIVDYELQKTTPEGPEIRWVVYPTDPRLLGAARNLSSAEWQALVIAKRPRAGFPQRHLGPIASGDKVIAFTAALDKYRETWTKLIGVEMESGGAAMVALQAADPPGFFMIRGVSDLADVKKGTARATRWRSYACDVAAAFTVSLLRSGPVPPPANQRPSKSVEQISTPHCDPYAFYLAGLRNLLKRVGPEHPYYSEVLVYQQRLIENVNLARQFGDTDTLKAERAQVINRLNALAFAAVGVSFNDLCH